MGGFLNRFLQRYFRNIFRNRSHVRLGLYGPPNAGKSTLANRICKDWLGQEMSTVSAIPHETREIKIKENVTIKSKGKSISFNLVDTPGIATKIDYEEFMKFKMNKDDAKERAK